MTYQIAAPPSVEQTLSELVLPKHVNSVVLQHATVFHEPCSLPPAREFDHQITLIPGAQPINVRPYRYAPNRNLRLKDKWKKC